VWRVIHSLQRFQHGFDTRDIRGGKVRQRAAPDAASAINHRFTAGNRGSKLINIIQINGNLRAGAGKPVIGFSSATDHCPYIDTLSQQRGYQALADKTGSACDKYC
jgi:hypothetical protein